MVSLNSFSSASSANESRSPSEDVDIKDRRDLDEDHALALEQLENYGRLLYPDKSVSTKSRCSKLAMDDLSHFFSHSYVGVAYAGSHWFTIALRTPPNTLSRNLRTLRKGHFAVNNLVDREVDLLIKFRLEGKEAVRVRRNRNARPA